MPLRADDSALPFLLPPNIETVPTLVRCGCCANAEIMRQRDSRMVACDVGAAFDGNPATGIVFELVEALRNGLELRVWSISAWRPRLDDGEEQPHTRATANADSQDDEIQDHRFDQGFLGRAAAVSHANALNDMTMLLRDVGGP